MGINLKLTLTWNEEPVPPPVEPPKKYVGWRVLHKYEGGYQGNPQDKPEVMPPEPGEAVEMTEDIQKRGFELMYHYNNLITPKLWTRVHWFTTAFNNFKQNGFNDVGVLHDNFITGKDVGVNDLPRYDKAQRQSGGNFLRGEDRGDGYLYCIPGVHGVHAGLPLPSLEEIIENHWLLYAVTLYLIPGKIGHFPQGQGGPVVMPFIFDKVIRFPLSWLEPWNEDFLPDPLKFYRV